MSNKHEKRFIVNMLIGMLLIAGGVFCIVYSGIMDDKKDWIFWAVISASGICAGLLFLGSSLIHKVKADLIRRQKQILRPERNILHDSVV